MDQIIVLVQFLHYSELRFDSSAMPLRRVKVKNTQNNLTPNPLVHHYKRVSIWRQMKLL